MGAETGSGCAQETCELQRLRQRQQQRTPQQQQQRRRQQQQQQQRQQRQQQQQQRATSGDDEGKTGESRVCVMRKGSCLARDRGDVCTPATGF